MSHSAQEAFTVTSFIYVKDFVRVFVKGMPVIRAFLCMSPLAVTMQAELPISNPATPFTSI